MNLPDHSELLLHHYKAEELAHAAKQRQDAALLTPPLFRQHLARLIGSSFMQLGARLMQYGRVEPGSPDIVRPQVARYGTLK